MDLYEVSYKENGSLYKCYAWAKDYEAAGKAAKIQICNPNAKQINVSLMFKGKSEPFVTQILKNELGAPDPFGYLLNTCE